MTPLSSWARDFLRIACSQYLVSSGPKLSLAKAFATKPLISSGLSPPTTIQPPSCNAEAMTPPLPQFFGYLVIPRCLQHRVLTPESMHPGTWPSACSRMILGILDRKLIWNLAESRIALTLARIVVHEKAT